MLSLAVPARLNSSLFHVVGRSNAEPVHGNAIITTPTNHVRGDSLRESTVREAQSQGWHRLRLCCYWFITARCTRVHFFKSYGHGRRRCESRMPLNKGQAMTFEPLPVVVVQEASARRIWRVCRAQTVDGEEMCHGLLPMRRAVKIDACSEGPERVEMSCIFRHVVRLRSSAGRCSNS